MVQKSVGCSAHREEQAKSVPRWGLWDGGFRNGLRQSALVGGEDAQTPCSASLSCVWCVVGCLVIVCAVASVQTRWVEWQRSAGGLLLHGPMTRMARVGLVRAS